MVYFLMSIFTLCIYIQAEAVEAACTQHERKCTAQAICSAKSSKIMQHEWPMMQRDDQLMSFFAVAPGDLSSLFIDTVVKYARAADIELGTKDWNIYFNRVTSADSLLRTCRSRFTKEEPIHIREFKDWWGKLYAVNGTGSYSPVVRPVYVSDNLCRKRLDTQIKGEDDFFLNTKVRSERIPLSFILDALRYVVDCGGKLKGAPRLRAERALACIGEIEDVMKMNPTYTTMSYERFCRMWNVYRIHRYHPVDFFGSTAAVERRDWVHRSGSRLLCGDSGRTVVPCVPWIDTFVVSEKSKVRQGRLCAKEKTIMLCYELLNADKAELKGERGPKEEVSIIHDQGTVPRFC